MLTIRLQRLGKKSHALYRMFISEKGRDTRGKHLEILGNFDPHKENGLTVQTERVKYWLGKGAQTSNTVHNLLLKAGILSGTKKKKAVFISKARAEKLAAKKGAEAKTAPVAPEASKV